MSGARLLSSAALLGLVVVLGGCSSESEGPGGSGGSGAGPCGGRGEQYVQNLSKDGTKFKFSLTDALPAPPARYANSWKLKVVDGSGSGMSGGSVTATPWMPDHGHGSALVVGTDLGGGEYQLDDIKLFMPGYWEVTVDAQDSVGESDSAVFAFCIEG